MSMSVYFQFPICSCDWIINKTDHKVPNAIELWTLFFVNCWTMIIIAKQENKYNPSLFIYSLEYSRVHTPGKPYKQKEAVGISDQTEYIHGQWVFGSLSLSAGPLQLSI